MTIAESQLHAADLIERVRQGLIGRHAAIRTPFGHKPLVYADYTASGRSLDFLEQAIRDQVLPWYANTHTEASHTGLMSGRLRAEARRAVAESVNAGSDDCVIFTGSGATSAINKWVALLGLNQAESASTGDDRPVVFIGPYEHHSNELPWRESNADVVRIGLDASGGIDQHALEQALLAHAHRPLRIGSFSAASNVTGVISDVVGITQLLKRHGALACWDYAAAGPYVAIDMNRQDAECDALFLSPHKFIGGPGTPGVLVVKRRFCSGKRPTQVGGGTVAYVSPETHTWLDDPVSREEAGTPAVVESIRAGAVFRLKDRIGAGRIEQRERELSQQVMSALLDIPGVTVLGSTSAPRLPIFSLLFEHDGKQLHPGFVAALLNDLFGIQVRAGCSCAGPYGHSLLNIDSAHSSAIADAVAQGWGCLKPGWVRFNAHWSMTDDELRYLLGALRLVATQGWRLLPHYRLDPHRGSWVHRDVAAQFNPLNDGLGDGDGPQAAVGSAIDRLLDGSERPVRVQAWDVDAALQQAECALLVDPPMAYREGALQEGHNLTWPETVARLCWFALPAEGLVAQA